VDFTLPEHLPPLPAEMDAFIDAEITPLEREHMQYLDRRREFARTDLDNGGVPRREWEDLLDEMRRRADAAGWLRYGLPSKFGCREGTNLDMAVIREHLAHRGLGLHNDLQDESADSASDVRCIPRSYADQRPGFLRASVPGHEGLGEDRGHGPRHLRAAKTRRRYLELAATISELSLRAAAGTEARSATLGAAGRQRKSAPTVEIHSPGEGFIGPAFDCVQNPWAEHQTSSAMSRTICGICVES